MSIGEVLLVRRYPELEPSYYFVLVTTEGRRGSFVTVDAWTGRWQAYGEIPAGTEFPVVSRAQAAELVRSKLDRECDPDGLRAVSMPNKILYWYWADRETFVSLIDPSDIRVGLDADLRPWRSEPEEFPLVPEHDHGGAVGRYPPSYDIQDVPHYYQQTSCSCGPAALEMVFDYCGEHVNQTDIARAANCNSAIGAAVAYCEESDACIDHCDIYANAAGDTICGSCDELGRNENMSHDPLYCDAAAYDFTLHDDSPCLPAQNPWGEQIGRYGAGACGLSGVGDGELPVTSLALHAPSPNPFGTAAAVRYEVPATGGRLAVTVFNLSGRVVKTLYDGPAPNGRGTLVWDGTDAAGNHVASGVYFVRASFGREEVSRKVVVLR